MIAIEDVSWQGFASALRDVYLDPLLTGAAAGALLGFLGVYVVLRRMVFISAALSQVSAVGVALAFYLQIHAGLSPTAAEPTVLALLLSLGSTFLFRADTARLNLSRDALLGLAYVVAGALALILSTRITQEAHDLTAILFGTGVAVRPIDLVLTLAVGAPLLALHVLSMRGLAMTTFDPVGAQVQRLPVTLLDTFLFFSIAVAVAITTRALGALPVFGFTVLPAMTALMLTHRLGWVLFWAALSGALAGTFGYVYAYFARMPVGACQVLIAGVLALTALAGRLVVTSKQSIRLRLAAALGGAAILALTFWPPLTGSAPHQDQPAALPDSTTTTSIHQTNEAVADRWHELHHQDLEMLRRQLRSAADPDERAAAAHRLAEIHHCACGGDLEAAMADPDWGVRAEAAEALGQVGGTEHVAVLLQALQKDESSWVRAAAAKALGAIDRPEVQTALQQAADHDPDETVRTAAHSARNPAAPPTAALPPDR